MGHLRPRLHLRFIVFLPNYPDSLQLIKESAFDVFLVKSWDLEAFQPLGDCAIKLNRLRRRGNLQINFLRKYFSFNYGEMCDLY